MKRACWMIVLLVALLFIVGLGKTGLASPTFPSGAWVDLTQITNESGIYIATAT